MQALLLVLAMSYEELRRLCSDLPFLGDPNVGLPVVTVRPDNAIDAVVSRAPALDSSGDRSRGQARAPGGGLRGAVKP